MTECKDMKISMHCILACLYFLLLPTTIAVNSAGNSILKLATIPIAAYFVISILFSKKVLQFNVVHLLLCGYTLSTLIALFVKTDKACIDTVVGYFLNAALYLCLTVIPYNDREIMWLENTQVLLLVYLVGATLFSGGTTGNRATLEIFGQITDPNYFVGYFVFPFSVALKNIMERKNPIVLLFIALLGVYCIFLSGSRGGVIALAGMLIAFGTIYPSKVETKMLVLLIETLLLLLAWFIAVPFLPENIIERMSIKSVVETGGSGRWDIQMSMIEEISKSPDRLLFGRGMDTLFEIFLEGKWSKVGSHSQLIQVLYNQGVVGLIAFLMLTIGCILRCINKRKTVAIAIIGMMALSISLSFNPTTRTFWNLVAYAALNFPEKNKYIASQNLKTPEEVTP